MSKDFINFNSLSNSYWISSTDETNFSKLNKDINVDVAIVGGGMVGILSAYILKNEGLKVAIIESDKILKATTAHTTAKVTSQHSLIYDKLIKRGKKQALQYANANETAIHIIKDIIDKEQIDCDFSYRPSFIYTKQDKNIEKIKREVKAAKDLGIKASFVKDIPLPIKIKGALKFENQAQFHPLKFLLPLSYKINKDGSFIFEKTKAIDINKEKNQVITDKGIIKAKNIIIASHFPFYDKRGLYFSRLYTERSYVLAIKAKEKFPSAMFINAESPARSLRSQTIGNEELILVIGDNHKTGQGKNTKMHYNNLLKFSKKIFTVKDIPYRWSTQDCMPLDDVPYIGNLTSNTPNIYVATGFKKWGMTTSMVSALIFKELILNGKSKWKEVYNPSRFTPLASFKNFFKENLNVAEKFLLGKILPETDKLNLDLGEGKVIERNGEKLGVYKDDDNKLYIVDTTCTHLGCELSWNQAEKSWDCPCHGSRFKYDGEVIEGPAKKQLNIKIIENHNMI
ncbi:MAG: FAD-dependent oxidoreductase [Firmicutes bacterium]|nr:FAD-dependent oxidoreductase [Bacillota bacterium]